MATPNWDLIPVRGHYVGSNGEPITGRVIFTPKVSRMVDAALHRTIIGKAQSVSLVDGRLETHLPASDDPDITPSGFTWVVKEDFNGGSTYEVEIPLSAAGVGVELATLAPVAPNTGSQLSPVTRLEFNALRDLVNAGGENGVAGQIPFTPTGSIAATNVQGAITEVASEATLALGGHLGNPTAHSANQITVTGIPATPSVQAALDKLYGDTTDLAADVAGLIAGGGGGQGPSLWVDASRGPYNADKTGATDARAAIQAAIDAVAAAGGGTVFLPAGVYQIAYAGNAGGTGCAGGLQLRDSVTLRGEGVATRLFGSGVWFTQAGIVAVGDAVTTRAVRDASVRELWIKTSAGSGHTTSIANCNGILLNSDGIVTEPDAAHRLLDLTIWDCDRGIAVYGVADRAVLGQRIRLRHFLRQAVLIGKENNSGGGADGYWSDIDASSANRVSGGSYATFEIRSSNCHFVNCKAWYSKRETAFVESGDYIAGAGFALLAPRTTMVACEAQDNGGHGIVVRVGQQTLTSCVADSNNRSDCISGAALPYECSGFYVGASATNVTILAANSFDKRSDLGERFQRHGYAIHSSSRNIEVRGIARDNRSSSTSATPNDAVGWVGGSAHETHTVFVQATYESQRAIISNDSGSGVAYIPVVDTRTTTQPARRIELDFPLATSNPNLEEVRDERDEIITWFNEAGQYRFRNGYSTWADAGVRGIIEPGDYVGTANAGGNFMELVDRNLPDTAARKLWGVRWETGKMVRQGVEVPDLVVRQAASDPITAPANSVIVTLDGEQGQSGTMQHTWDGGALPTVAGSVTVDATSIVNADSLKIANDAAAANARFTLTSAKDQVVTRFYIRTPASWSSAAATIFALRPTNVASTIASVQMTGSGSPGRLRLTTVGGVTVAESPSNTILVNTNYRIEVRYNGATGTAVLSVYPMGEDVPSWSSGVMANANFVSPILRVDIGRVNTTPAVSEFYLDGIYVASDTTGTLPRHSGDTLSPTAVPKPPYAGAISFWDGTKLWPLVNH